MTSRKRQPKTSSTQMGRVLILLEEMREQNHATIEAVFSSEQRTNRRLEEIELKLTRRLDVLEVAVRMNSDEIRKNSEDIKKNSEDIKKNSEDIKKNSEDIERMSREIREMRGMLERKADHAALVALEQRVSALEKRVGL